MDPKTMSNATSPMPLLPNAPQPTDVLGNVTPAGMVDTAQAPPQQQQPGGGPDTLANPMRSPTPGGANMFQRLSAQGSPFLKKFSAATTNALKSADPATVTKPGALTRLLVGGAIEALGAGLGDAAAVGTVPSGAGALTGVTRTLAARGERLGKEKQQKFQNEQEASKNNALIAEANARTLHTQKLVHQMDQADIDTGIQSGQTQLETITRVDPFAEIQKGLDSDAITKGLQDGTFTPAQAQKALPTGKKVVGENPDGTPKYRTTYSIVTPRDVTLDPSKPEDKKQLDWLNKYAPPKSGKWGDGGQQSFAGDQYLSLAQSADQSEAATMARDKTLVDRKLASRDNVRKMEAVNFQEHNDDWVKALGEAPGHDVMAARNSILSNPETAGRWPNLDDDLRFQYGEKSYDKMLEDYQKRIDTGLSDTNEFQKKLDTAHGEEAASMAQGIQSKLDQNPPPIVRQRLQKQLDQANKQAKASLDFAADKKSAEADAESKASEGDLSALKDMVLSYQYEPDKLFARFKGIKQKQEFIADMHRIDPTWSEAEYRARFNTANDYRPDGKGGQAKRSLNAFAGHIGDANGLIETLHNTKSPLLNTPINKWKEDVLGQPQFIAYRQAIQAAGDEYLSFLLNNRAKHKSDDDLVEKMNSTDVSPSTAQGMLRQMANTIAIRARAQNKAYRDQMGGKDIPNFLDPDTNQVLRTFGIDPKSITSQGTSGLIHSGQSEEQKNLPPVPQGMVRIKTPKGTMMNIPKSQQDQATASGAIVVNQ